MVVDQPQYPAEGLVPYDPSCPSRYTPRSSMKVSAETKGSEPKVVTIQQRDTIASPTNSS